MAEKDVKPTPQETPADGETEAKRAHADVATDEVSDDRDLLVGRAPDLPQVKPLGRNTVRRAEEAQQRLREAEAERHAASIELFAARTSVDQGAEDNPDLTVPLPEVARLRGLSPRQLSQLDPSVRDHYLGGYLLAQTTRTPAEQAQEMLAAHGRVVTAQDALTIYAQEFGEDALDALAGPGVSTDA